MNILISGAGAVGAYFGGRLGAAGADVSVICRSDYDEVKANGFQISSVKGDFVFKPSQVLRSASEYQGKADLIIVGSKVLPEIDIPSMIKDAVSPDTVILLAQNGIDIEKDVHAAFPDNEILSAIIYIGCTKTAPGIIAHTGGPGSMTFGEFRHHKAGKNAQALLELFQKTPCPAELVDNIQYYRWKKLLWNIPFNSISVLGGGLLTNQMTDRGHLEALCSRIMYEIIDVARSKNIELEESLVAENIEYTRNFTPYATSMLADFRRRRPLEVEAIVGNVCRIAIENNIDIPCIQTIYALLRAVADMQK
ncbi:MAG: 2-dehydropantoate 2-reductase [Lentisphaeria bacterium]|nr:2-dehydropantoate 2-reductase [Lentisphaeria bacterium]